MAFVGVRPTAEVSDELRRMFVRLTIETEVRGASLWVIKGGVQSPIRGAGSFHKEGKYLLKCVAKQWSKGYLYAISQSHREDYDFKFYSAKTAGATFISTSEEALKKLMPDSQVEVIVVGGL